MSDVVIDRCSLCPRKCYADRRFEQGFCMGKDKIRIARAALHQWEEPCISGSSGSGTVFFSGCHLKCVYCQNYKISAENFGTEISIKRLADIFLELQESGAENINLVSPTHYVPWIIKSLDMVKSKLNIPLVYNSNGYERIETLQLLKGYIDIYLPDLKYAGSDLSMRYSFAKDYFMVTTNAIKEMFSQVGSVNFNGEKLMSGVIIRHLALPNHRQDSFKVLDWIADNFSGNEVLLSLMSQFTPCYRCNEFSEINRRISTFEYNKILQYAVKLGLKGFMQERSSAKEEYTPPFNLEGVN